MSRELSHDNRQESVWNSIVVPTAVGLEAFFWRLAWFGFLLGFFFGGCLLQQVSQNVTERSRASEQEQRAAPQLPGPQPGS